MCCLCNGIRVSHYWMAEIPCDYTPPQWVVLAWSYSWFGYNNACTGVSLPDYALFWTNIFTIQPTSFCVVVFMVIRSCSWQLLASLSLWHCYFYQCSSFVLCAYGLCTFIFLFELIVYCERTNILLLLQSPLIALHWSSSVALALRWEELEALVPSWQIASWLVECFH